MEFLSLPKYVSHYTLTSQISQNNMANFFLLDILAAKAVNTCMKYIAGEH